MNIQEAIKERHSVRSYRLQTIPENIRSLLNQCAAECSQEGNLRIFIQYDDPDGFDSALAHYGKFRNVNHYIVLAGAPSPDFNLRCGYYGEKLVLYAQQLGLNTCWAALTFNKRRVKQLLNEGESLCMVIALGYGETQGVPHTGKDITGVSRETEAPQWFYNGVNAALLAPTAVNQQKFWFSLKNGRAYLRSHGIGTFLQTDLGIVKYHFEAASGHAVQID